jgi:hypothetical protein
MSTICPGAEIDGRPIDRSIAVGDLAGRWILTMPGGAQWNARFEKFCRCNHIHLFCGATMLRGEYDLSGTRLAMERPDDEKMVGLVWKVKNRNLLELVEHPASSQFGSDYRGAVLVRRIDDDRDEIHPRK